MIIIIIAIIRRGQQTHKRWSCHIVVIIIIITVAITPLLKRQPHCAYPSKISIPEHFMHAATLRWGFKTSRQRITGASTSATQNARNQDPGTQTQPGASRPLAHTPSHRRHKSNAHGTCGAATSVHASAAPQALHTHKRAQCTYTPGADGRQI